jgi:hypothetical protein
MTPDTMPHLDESELLHLIDRDAEAPDLQTWAAHAEECESCASALARLRRRAERFSTRLADLQLPADFRYPAAPRPAAARASLVLPVRGAGAGGWLRAAAVVLVLLAPLLLVEPVRAWVAERLGLQRPEVSTPAADGRGAPIPGAPGEASGSTVWFTPAAAEIRVEILHTQAGGALVVRPAAGPEGSLEILGGAGEMPLLTEAGVTIRNEPGSAARYELSVPPRVERVLLRVGEGPVRVLRPHAEGGPLEIDLRRPG